MELKTYILPAIRWWWLLLLASVLAAVTSFIMVRQEPDRYQTQTTLMIGQAIQDPNPSGNQLFLGNQLAALYADIAMREQVRQATMEALNLRRLPSYHALALPNRQLLQIVVVDTSPVRAQAVANELANQLILLSPDGTSDSERDRNAFITEQLDRLEEQITATEDEIQVAEETLGGLFSARDIADTHREINALCSKLSALQSTYAGLLSGTRQSATNTISVIEPAYLPTSPVGPHPLLTVIAATIIAFVLATAAAYLLDYLDDTIRSPDQISRRIGVPVVGTIARFQNGDGTGGLIMRDNPRSPEAEGFRGLRVAVQFSLNANNAKSLLITSPHQGDGKSLIAANLALALAQSGLRTLLIDLDLHRPSQHKVFGVDNEQGLSTLLYHLELLDDKAPMRLPDTMVDELINRDTGLDRLALITSGPITGRPSELLINGTVKKLMAALMPRYDVIVVDAPPALAVSDAVALSTQVDSVFILASVKQTRKADLRNVLERMNNVGANVSGIILNQLSTQSEYYHYRYSDYDMDSDAEPKDARRTVGSGNESQQRAFGWRLLRESLTNRSHVSDG